MQQNKYDDDQFFKNYAAMPRSKDGLKAAGEWYELEKILPNFQGKKVLDLGCGYGWHCKYAANHGALEVVGIDLSHKMLEVANKMIHLILFLVLEPVIIFQILRS